MSNNLFQQTIVKDERPLLSIIKLYSADQQLIDALSDLIDNNYIKEREQKLIIKTFISTQKVESDFIKQIKQNLMVDQKNLFESCQGLVQQLIDIQKMQFSQQLSHTLLFSSLDTVQYNDMHQALQFLQQHQITNKLKILKSALINFTSLNYKETKIVQKEYEGKIQQNLVYIEFQKQQNKNESNLFKDKYIINKQGKLNWLDIKDDLKQQVKRRLELAKSQIIILQFFINPLEDQNNDSGIISYDLNCIQKIVNFFKKLASDKLYINLIIKKLDINQSKVQSEVERLNKQKILYNLKSFINAIEQGIVNQKIIYEKSQNNLQLKMNISELQQKIKDNKNSIFMNKEYQRILNNKILKLNVKPIAQQNKQYTNKIPIIERNGEIKLIDVYYQNQNQKLEVTQQSQLIINYNENVLILFYYNEFKLYYCQNIMGKDSMKLEAQLLDIVQYKDTESIKLVKKVIPPNILIQNNKIYLLYGYLGDKLLEYNMNEQSIQIKQKGYLSNNNNIIKESTEFRENIKYRDGACISCNKQLFNGSTFAIIGGELGSESKLCNIIEQVYINNSDFESGMIVKEKLNSKKSFRPFKDQLILEDNNYLIILPGDYNNQNYKFSQVINPSFYKQAMKLKKINENNYQWETIEIIYSDRLIQKKQYQYRFLSKQNNIKKVQDNHWIALINLFDEFPKQQCEEDQYQNILKFDFQLKDQKLIVDYNFISNNNNQEDGISTGPQSVI